MVILIDRQNILNFEEAVNPSIIRFGYRPYSRFFLYVTAQSQRRRPVVTGE